MDQAETVFVIAGVADQQAISAVAASLGFCSFCFTTAEQFAARLDEAWQGCVVLDVALAEGGLQRVEQVRDVAPHLPLVVLSTDVNVAAAVEIMRRGARTVLEKPCPTQRLATSLTDAVDYHRCSQHHRSWERDLKLRLDTLHPRERMVLDLMVADVPNKTIARRLGVGRRTVDRIRSCVLEKMGADSPVAMARIMGEARPLVALNPGVTEPAQIGVSSAPPASCMPQVVTDLSLLTCEPGAAAPLS
jgi:FixJ family two-component response regulator